MFKSVSDRFEEALESARNTLKRARSQFQNCAIAKEQKELFGYSSRSSHASKGKKPRPVPWTKQFVCLAYCDQSRVPIADEELDELFHAGLGMKKITIFDINNVTDSMFRKIMIDNFRPLEKAGGFEFLRSIPNTKQLEVFSELAQSNPKVLQERSNKGKIYIRPLQQDLIQSSRKTTTYVCFVIVIYLACLISCCVHSGMHMHWYLMQQHKCLNGLHILIFTLSGGDRWRE